MTDIKTLDYRDTTIGEAAVDGLPWGVLGGVLMAVYLEVSGLLMGSNPGEMLGRFNPQEGDPLLVAFLLQLASGVLLPGAGSALLEIPLIHFGIAHLIFGTVIGWLIYRSRIKT
jgi:hypothetical protein